jgi:hypothetical protein
MRRVGFRAISYILTKTMWLWILLGLAILVILFYSPRENMTNDQLIDTLKTFGEQGTSSSSEKFGQSAKPIYGPNANPPPVPTNTGGAGGGKTVAGPYPQIFGPDVTNAPGTRSSSGSVKSGNPVTPGQVASDKALGAGCQGPADNFHEFNPDLAKAFPVDGPPQPFLTDFSKIQH